MAIVWAMGKSGSFAPPSVYHFFGVEPWSVKFVARLFPCGPSPEKENQLPINKDGVSRDTAA